MDPPTAESAMSRTHMPRLQLPTSKPYPQMMASGRTIITALEVFLGRVEQRSGWVAVGSGISATDLKPSACHDVPPTPMKRTPLQNRIAKANCHGLRAHVQPPIR
jgi:hypothetical protein